MITYGSTTLTSYNSIVRTEVYYYKSTSATSLSGGSWSTTKPTWENGKYIWQKIRTVYEDGTHTESDPVNITGQQGATGTAAYSYKLNSSDSIIGKTKDGEYTIKKIIFSATYKQGTGAVSAYGGRFKIESTTNGSTWKTEYTSSGNETSKEFTIPDDIIAIKCSLYQSDGTTVLLDIVTVPVVKDGVDAIGLRDSIPYYLASDKDTGITRLTQGWTRYRPQLTAEKKYLWVYYVSRYSEGTTEPELIEIKDDLVHFINNGDESPVESCVVDIEPVQDLNGYDSPWPAGGGKNMLNPSDPDYGNYTISPDGTVTTNQKRITTGFIPCDEGVSLTFSTNKKTDTVGTDIRFGFAGIAAYDENKNFISREFINNQQSVTMVTPTGTKYVRAFEEITANGSPSTLTPKVFATYKQQLEPGSTATAYSPYSNICPITGWTEAKVTRCGKNLAEFTHGKGVDTTGHIHNIANRSATVTPIKIDNTRQYKYVNTNSNVAGIYAVWNGDTLVRRVSGVVNGTVMDTSGGDLLYVCGYSSNIDVLPETCGVFFADQYEEFEPYSGQTYDITFPSEAGTVYGGTLDVTSGVLTVDMAMVDLGTLTWTRQQNPYASLSDTYIFNAGIADSRDPLYPKRNFGGILSSFKWVTNYIYFTDDCSAGYIFGTQIAIRYDAYTDETAFKTAVTGQTLAYELATPIIYQLTPQEITMLCQENNIFADTGQTAISYYDNQTSTDPYVDYSLTSAFDTSTDALDKAKEVAQDLADLQAQIDGKIETWCQITDPSTAWTTTELKNQHNGDLWYYTGESTSSYKNNTTYKYTASTNKWTAYSASTDLFDKIDAKTSIYYGKPSAVTQNLEVGDYLVDSTDGCSYRWDGSKWVKLTDYQAAIDEIEVGGRNFAVNCPGSKDWYTLHVVDGTNKVIYLFGSASDNTISIPDIPDIKIGDIIQLSFDIKFSSDWQATGTGTKQSGIQGNYNVGGTWAGINYAGGGGTQKTELEAIMASESKEGHINTWFKVIDSMLDGTYSGICMSNIRFDYYSGTVSVRHVMVEKGTKPTDWTPAPEDVDASIATAQTTADTAIDRATAIYGTCSTDSTVDAKVVVCPDFVLFDGARIQVTFTNANTASAPTLNVNNTGAKAIYINKTVTSSSNLLLWTAGSKMEFVYDGTGWIAQNVPYALYGTCSTGASTAAKDVICNEAVICKGTTISVNMTNTNTAANATMNVGSTLAKDIYANGAKLTTNSRFNWRANTTQKFVFDGQVWRMDDDSVKALATAYITEIDDDGIMVHPEDDSNSGWAISDAIQLFKNGISYIKLWIENNIPKIRIGKEDQGHIILDNDSVDIRNDDTVLASFGATSVIGDTNDWHQTIAANQITFAKGNETITYISPDKLYTINAEVADAFYISNYSIRNASDGKLVIGLRR